MKTPQEVFNEISDHQVVGIMLHADMADYYDFLGLMGFKRMHEYHALDEFAEMRGVHRYFINHYNTLIVDGAHMKQPVIPAAWHNFTRTMVEPEARKDAIKSCMHKWVDWEKATKALYQKCYTELCDTGEVAAACKVKSLVEGVDQELKHAERLALKLDAAGYDMPIVVAMQDEMHEHYKCETDGIGVKIC